MIKMKMEKLFDQHLTNVYDEALQNTDIFI